MDRFKRGSSLTTQIQDNLTSDKNQTLYCLFIASIVVRIMRFFHELIVYLFGLVAWYISVGWFWTQNWWRISSLSCQQHIVNVCSLASMYYTIVHLFSYLSTYVAMLDMVENYGQNKSSIMKNYDICHCPRLW
jgi:hypothetical protein